MAFSQGPWTAIADGRHHHSVRSAAGHWFGLARVVTRLAHANERNPVGLANLRLILAAPDGYEAARAALDALRELPASELRQNEAESVFIAIDKLERYINKVDHPPLAVDGSPIREED